MEMHIDTNSRILIISPHPDDETIGMGGFLIKNKANCEVLLATNGALGNPEWSKEVTVEVRKKEFESNLRNIGIKTYYMLDIMDQELDKNLLKLKKYLTNKYDYIFVPSRHDLHPDHKCLYRYVNRCIKIRRLKCVVVEYEVWTPLNNPNFFFDISDCYREKEKAVQTYECQLKHVRYDWGSLGLNRYRGMLSDYSYAEAFRINISIFRKIREKITTLRKR